MILATAPLLRWPCRSRPTPDGPLDSLYTPSYCGFKIEQSQLQSDSFSATYLLDALKAKFFFELLIRISTEQYDLFARCLFLSCFNCAMIPLQRIDHYCKGDLDADSLPPLSQIAYVYIVDPSVFIGLRNNSSLLQRLSIPLRLVLLCSDRCADQQRKLLAVNCTAPHLTSAMQSPCSMRAHKPIDCCVEKKNLHAISSRICE